MLQVLIAFRSLWLALSIAPVLVFAGSKTNGQCTLVLPVSKTVADVLSTGRIRTTSTAVQPLDDTFCIAGPEHALVCQGVDKPAVKRSWRMDETTIKIKGRDCYLYRAVDKEGNTVDFLLTEKRDKKAATAFFAKAFRQHGQPEKVSIDKSGSNISALTSCKAKLKDHEPKITIYQSKYLNNIVEQDHRFVKRITRPMMQFKAFYSAKATLSGIELYHMLRKGQYPDSELTKPWEYIYSLAA